MRISDWSSDVCSSDLEDDAAVDVAGGAADRLHEAGFAAQKAFLVGIEDRNEPAFGNVEPFAEQVDPDQHVEHPEPQRSEERRVGTEGVSQCRSRWSPDH